MENNQKKKFKDLTEHHFSMMKEMGVSVTNERLARKQLRQIIKDGDAECIMNEFNRCLDLLVEMAYSFFISK